MDTLKRFIHYYKPYRTVFFLDLICAATISVIDLVYPQILRTATNSLFTKDSGAILKMLVPIALGLFVMYTIQSLIPDTLLQRTIQPLAQTIDCLRDLQRLAP